MSMFKRRVTTSIEISDRHIKLVQILTKGQSEKVIACLFKEFSPDDPKAAGAELKNILKEHNLRPRHIILTIPRQSVTTKILKLPSQNPLEISDMAGFQAVKQIPYPKEEIAYGFNIIGVDPQGFSSVMLVICHKDVIERPLNILRSRGLSPEKVTLSSFGLLNWFNLNGESRKKSESLPVILVDYDALSIDIAIVHMSKLIYTRGLTFGPAEGEKNFERLRSEIDKTLTSYEKESETIRAGEAVFTGNISGITGLKDELEKSLNMKVEFIDPFERAPLNIPASKYQSYVTQASYSSLIGTAVGGEEVDLIPRALKISRATGIIKKKSAISVILTLAVIASASFMVWNEIHNKELSLKILESELKDIAPAAEEIEKMRLSSDVIKSQLIKKSEVSDILNELYKIVPPNIYLVLCTYEDERVELKGTANVLSDVFKLVTILENSTYFQNVKVRYATKRKVGGEELIDFEISCPLGRWTGVKR
jgi:Tfp pilus assembly PilM family ATPase/Tfp pilus assembly protein PilN